MSMRTPLALFFLGTTVSIGGCSVWLSARSTRTGGEGAQCIGRAHSTLFLQRPADGPPGGGPPLDAGQVKDYCSHGGLRNVLLNERIWYDRSTRKACDDNTAGGLAAFVEQLRAEGIYVGAHVRAHVPPLDDNDVPLWSELDEHVVGLGQIINSAGMVDLIYFDGVQYLWTDGPYDEPDYPGHPSHDEADRIAELLLSQLKPQPDLVQSSHDQLCCNTRLGGMDYYWLSEDPVCEARWRAWEYADRLKRWRERWHARYEEWPATNPGMDLGWLTNHVHELSRPQDCWQWMTPDEVESVWALALKHGAAVTLLTWPSVLQNDWADAREALGKARVLEEERLVAAPPVVPGPVPTCDQKGEMWNLLEDPPVMWTKYELPYPCQGSELIDGYIADGLCQGLPEEEWYRIVSLWPTGGPVDVTLTLPPPGELFVAAYHASGEPRQIIREDDGTTHIDNLTAQCYIKLGPRWKQGALVGPPIRWFIGQWLRSGTAELHTNI